MLEQGYLTVSCPAQVMHASCAMSPHDTELCTAARLTHGQSAWARPVNARSLQRNIATEQRSATRSFATWRLLGTVYKSAIWFFDTRCRWSYCASLNTCNLAWLRLQRNRQSEYPHASLSFAKVQYKVQVGALIVGLTIAARL